MEINYDKLANDGGGCIEEVKNALDLNCNHRTGKLIGRVLHTVRNSLSYAQSAELIQHLPDDAKIIYVSDWKLKSNKLELRHLNSLVEEVIKNDRQHQEQVFNDEAFALHAILVTLRILDKHTEIMSQDFFNYSLKQELAEAMAEAA